MHRNVYLAALALATCLTVTTALPVVSVDVPLEGNEVFVDSSTSLPSTVPAGEEEIPARRQRPDEATELGSGENAVPRGEGTLSAYCRCYEMPGGLELCVTIVFEENDQGELVARKRRFVRSVASKK